MGLDTGSVAQQEPSRSGSGTRVVLRGTDSVRPAFCALPILLFGSVAEICQGQEKAIGGDLGHFASSNGVAQDLGGMGWTHYYQNSV